jgi:hypothetical protein
MTALQDRQKELVGYLTVGFPKLALRAWALAGASACGGNFTQENLCKPVTEGQHDEGSDGMGQWRELRLTGDGDHGQKWGMRPWCVKYFGVWNTIEAQAAFTMFEVARDYPTLDAELRADLTGVKPANIRSVLDYKTKMFMELYERPNMALAGLAYRQSQAAAIYGLMTTGKAPVAAPAAKPTVPGVILAGQGVVVGAGTAVGGLFLTANGDLTTLAAVVISIILLTVVIGVPLILRPKAAKPIAAAQALTPFAKLTAALERRAIANAEVAEAAEELKESLQKSTDLLIAAGHQQQRSYQPQ